MISTTICWPQPRASPREVDLGLFEALLGHHDGVLRLTAAECLGRAGKPHCVECLAGAIEKETAASTLIALVWAVRDLHREHRDKISAEHLRRAVIAAGTQLGRVVERPAGEVLVDFLGTFRYQGSVPVLIAFLQRLQTVAPLTRPDQLGAAMPKRVNDVLRAMTGAMLPADEPAQWLAFWAREGGKIDVSSVTRAAGSKETGGTVSEFFGIPVRGSRVVFVLDFSGSMEWLMPQEAGGTRASRKRGKVRRIDKARQELIKAVNGLSVQQRFNVVFYAAEVRKWHKGLMPANAKNKQALALRVNALRAQGGTNLFGGLKSGLELKSLVYGARYDSHVDELFLLSDGVPTVGEVTDMGEILRQIGETNRYCGVRIHVIYLGSKSDEPQRFGGGRSEQEGGEFLRQLAEQNGGQFVWPTVSDTPVKRGR